MWLNVVSGRMKERKGSRVTVKKLYLSEDTPNDYEPMAA
jgi:hypothetical protein